MLYSVGGDFVFYLKLAASDFYGTALVGSPFFEHVGKVYKWGQSPLVQYD